MDRQDQVKALGGFFLLAGPITISIAVGEQFGATFGFMTLGAFMFVLGVMV